MAIFNSYVSLPEGTLLLFLLNAAQDAMDQVNYLAPKLLKLRLWPDLKEPGEAMGLLGGGTMDSQLGQVRQWEHG